MIFADRHEAGQLLAKKLQESHEWQDACILALPKGGVPVAWEISQRLELPLDLLFVKKIGHPEQEELAIGAVSEGGFVIWIDEMLATTGLERNGADKTKLEALAKSATTELEKKAAEWRQIQSPLPLQGKSVILVDDGLATGATMKAAIELLKKRGVKRTIVAAPVAAAPTAKEVRQMADETYILAEPTPFFSVGQWYENFEQVTDEQVKNLLKGKNGHTNIRDVVLSLQGTELPGHLAIPNEPKGLILFAHGSGSNHKSPRQQKVSKALHQLGFATLLFDLLTDMESNYRPNVFNIDLLAERLSQATYWARQIDELKNLPIGYFGASTGAAAALVAAAPAQGIRSVVSRGGRPDMAEKYLPKITMPVLLIVGGDDREVISLNEKAKAHLPNAQIAIVPGAGHLFEEPGTLDEVIELAADWFEQTLTGAESVKVSVPPASHDKTPQKGKVTAAPVLNIKPREEIVSVTKKLATPILTDESIRDLAGRLSKHQIVMLGEATHGTEEFYELRKKISRELIAHYGFKFVAVEGDWPDCARLNHYVKTGEGKSAAQVMEDFIRWPSWMWANYQTADFIEWLKGRDAGFYGLDVYSLFQSMDVVSSYAEKLSPQIRDRILEAFSCFESYHKDELAYARSLMSMPAGCTGEITNMLRSILRVRLSQSNLRQSELLDLRQNSKVLANADRYYHAMVIGDSQSWNIRDQHMLDSLDTLLHTFGPTAKGIVWAHNTHIGDYHATDMPQAGYVNLGGLAREKWGIENVCLVGFGTYQGKVLAGRAWGAKPDAMELPPAPIGTLEAYMHQAATEMHCDQFVLNFNHDPIFKLPHGHRAVGVVYQNRLESRHGNYVPTRLAERYDQFIFIDKTTALKALPSSLGRGLLPETWPIGV